MENESILRHSELSTSRAELSGIFSCRPLAESSGQPSIYHSLVVASTYISIASLYLSPIDMCGLDITCCIALMGDRDLRRRSVGRICSLGWWCISGFKCQSSICATTRRRCGLSSDQSRILFDQPQRKKCMRYSWLQMGRVVISGGTEIIGENTWWRFLIR